MKRTALTFLGLSFSFLACAAPEPGEPAALVADSAEAISASKVMLPRTDECRDVLAPLALGLADGGVGLDYATSITASLTSETDTRLYTISAVSSAGYSLHFDVELDNDSASKCFLLSATLAPPAKLDAQPRSKMKRREAVVTAPVAVTPADDECLESVKLLAGAAGAATVGRSALVSASVTFLGADENRYYRVHVDGRPFTVGGQTFENDYDFDLETSNDSAWKCTVQDFRRAGEATPR